MDLEFDNLNELYSRLKPALYSKNQEFKRDNISYIKEVDIWNYLSLNKWKNSKSLTLAEMVEDIMSLNKEDVKSYIHDILRKQDRNLEKVGDSLL